MEIKKDIDLLNYNLTPTSTEFRDLYIKSFTDADNYQQETNIQLMKSSNVFIKTSNIDGFNVDLVCPEGDEFHVKIYDDSDSLIYESILKNNWYSRLNRKYYTRWRTKVYNTNDELVVDEIFSLENKRVFIVLDSNSLGDTIAWIPYCEIFAKKHNCKVIVSTFFNDIFENQYLEIDFVKPSDIVYNIHAMYKIGCFNNQDMEPELSNIIPLQKIATNILGLDFEEIKPKLNFIMGERPIQEKYITIGMRSTAGCKEWSKEGGWQDLINKLNSMGYKVAIIQREPTNNIENVLDWTGDSPLSVRMNQLYHSEFYIGLSSGLSWLAWAMNKHVVMISNFTEDWNEFTDNITRIKNTSVCHGCWNNQNFKFDKGDWFWCPIHKGTERQFECQKSISSDDIMNKIKNLL